MNYYEDEVYYWFSEAKFNGCYRVQKENLETELLFRFPEEDLGQKRLHGDLKKVGDWLVFIPLTAKNIALFHMKTKEIKSFPLKSPKEGRKIEYSPNSKLARCFSLGHYLYFTPRTYPAIVKLDLETWSLEYLTDWMLLLEPHIETERDPNLNSYFAGSLKKNDFLLMACACCSCFGEFDLKKETFSVFPIETQSNAFQQIKIIDEKYWLTPRTGIIHTILDPVNKKSEQVEIDVRRSFNGDGEVAITNMTHYHQKYLLWYQLEQKTKFSIYDPVTKKNEIASILENVTHEENNLFYPSFPVRFCFKLSQIQDNILSYTSGYDHAWCSINFETGEVRKQYIQADAEGAQILLDHARKKFPENERNTLAEFCDFLTILQPRKDKEEGISIGQKILDSTTLGNVQKSNNNS